MGSITNDSGGIRRGLLVSKGVNGIAAARHILVVVPVGVASQYSSGRATGDEPKLRVRSVTMQHSRSCTVRQHR